MLPILTASVQLNIVYTILVIVGVIVFWIIEKLLVKKYEENMNKFLLLIVYFVLFSVLIVAFGGILVIWNFDLTTYFNEISLDTLTFIESSIGRIISSLVVIFIL